MYEFSTKTKLGHNDCGSDRSKEEQKEFEQFKALFEKLPIEKPTNFNRKGFRRVLANPTATTSRGISKPTNQGTKSPYKSVRRCLFPGDEVSSEAAPAPKLNT